MLQSVLAKFSNVFFCTPTYFHQHCMTLVIGLLRGLRCDWFLSRYVPTNAEAGCTGLEVSVSLVFREV